ncbi:MAG: uL15 family ribosomal protein, partial [Flavobacteriales bacterium]
AAVSHGTLSVKVNEDVNVQGGDAVAIGDGAQANAAGQAVPDTQITVEEETAKAFLFDAGVSLNELVDAINAVGATPSDLVANGLASKHDLVKILGRGELTAGVEVSAHQFSKSATAAIEGAGGKCSTIDPHAK